MKYKELEGITNEDVEEVINRYVHSERDRALLKRRFCDSINFEPLSEEFNLSVRQTQRIVSKYSTMIFTRVLK